MLDLSGNKFNTGVPDVVSKMTMLEKLNLHDCNLSDLLVSLADLRRLEKLGLSKNLFKRLPPTYCLPERLKQLDLSENKHLESLHRRILNFPELEELNVDDCPSLTTPPQNVCKQGLEAIIMYYKDMEKGEGRRLPAATVSVIGKSKAGKTSLIRTLQQNARVLTGSVGAEVDVSTKVFNFEEVEVENTKLRFIDFGGQEIYHLAYGLTLRSNCVPVIVVNMEMYKDMSEEIGDREAVRRLYFDWMAHLYLAQPDLRSPILVITHKDKFSPDEFEKIKNRFLSNSTGVRDTILEQEQRHGKANFQRIESLSETTQLFFDDNIFEVGSDDDQATIGSLKQQLLEHCKLHVMVVPRNWEEVEKGIRAQPNGVLLFDDLLLQLAEKHQVDKKKLEVILKYMHSSGKLLWYADSYVLCNYVFHQISVVTGLLNVLLDQDAPTKWETRLEQFASCRVQSEDFQLENFTHFAEKFKATGIMSKQLLVYLIHSETMFKGDEEMEAALKLLKSFRLAFEEVKTDGRPAYIFPHFAVGYSPSTPTTTCDIQLHVDLVFRGLPLPQYVYHEMTVELLKAFQNEVCASMIKRNGAVIEADELVVSLTHDSKSKIVSIFVASPTKDLVEAWEQLVNLVNNVTEHVQKTWRAATIVCIQYCAHCKLMGAKHVEKTVNPSWSILSTAPLEVRKNPMIKEKCGSDKVFVALKYPCKLLSEEDKERLIEYVASVKPTTLPPKENETLTAHGDFRLHTQSASSDVPSFKEIAKSLATCSVSASQDASIKALFNNTDQVYKMTSPRGIALIINNLTFHQDSQLGLRDGSSTDLKHMERLMKELSFEVQSFQDLSSQEMLDAIDDTAKLDDEGGMFVLVLMSHGRKNDQIYGIDGTVIELSDVYYLLSSKNFPAMEGKPKFLIVQACRGALRDFGDQGRHVLAEEESGSQPRVVRPKHSRYSGGLMTLPKNKIKHLDKDDLITFHATSKDYASMRQPTLGSPFICYLVYIFSKCACQMDVESLCKKVQNDFRKESIRLTESDPEHSFGQIPDVNSTLTDYRKLHLFPGYNG